MTILVGRSDEPCPAEDDGRGCIRPPGHDGRHVWAAPDSWGEEIVRLRRKLAGAESADRPREGNRG